MSETVDRKFIGDVVVTVEDQAVTSKEPITSNLRATPNLTELVSLDIQDVPGNYMRFQLEQSDEEGVETYISDYYYPNKYTYFRPVYNFNTDEKGGTRYEVEAVQIINTLTNRKTVISREQGASGKIKSGLEAMNLDSLIEFLINKTGA